MDSTIGNIGASDAAVLALLADTGRAGNRSGGYGGEGYGGGYGYHGTPFANTATIQHGIDNLGQKTEAQADCTREVLTAKNDQTFAALENLERANSFNRICDRLNQIDTQFRDNIFQQELRNSDRLRDIERELNANQRENSTRFCDMEKEMLKCCCETQNLIVSESAATRDLINQNTIRIAVDQNNISATVAGINSAAASNTAAIIAAIQSLNHHNHPRP